VAAFTGDFAIPVLREKSPPTRIFGALDEVTVAVGPKGGSSSVGSAEIAGRPGESIALRGLGVEEGWCGDEEGTYGV